MINQIPLPYIHMNKLPPLAYIIEICYNENITSKYIKKLQTLHVKRKLCDSYDNDLLNIIIRDINKSIMSCNISFPYFEYIEIINYNYQKKTYVSDIRYSVYGNNIVNITRAMDNVFNLRNIEPKCSHYTIDFTTKTLGKILSIPPANFDMAFLAMRDEEHDSPGYSDVEHLLINLLHMLYNIKVGGDINILIKNTHSAIYVDILFYLNALFSKVYISRPSSMKLCDDHRYIVCKNMSRRVDHVEIKTIHDYIYSHTIATGQMNVIHADTRMFKQDIPMFFRHRLDEVNCIFGQQILEYTMMVISNKPHEMFANIRYRYEHIKEWLNIHGVFMPLNIDRIVVNNTITYVLDGTTEKETDVSSVFT
uniref:Ribosomal RNA methyltransferase FtsJ domain-containing protein n=1 Tax=viral metagenome TaxID=1070528 RepID=A0A6C0LXT8_9ZZZZ